MRYSTRLFRLPSATAIARQLRFHNTGPSQVGHKIRDETFYLLDCILHMVLLNADVIIDTGVLLKPYMCVSLGSNMSFKGTSGL